VVEHRYSHSAGRASPLKAYYVERNRLFVAMKNFPAGSLWRVPLTAAVRYFWHVVSMATGRGAAAEFQRQGHGGLRLVWFVIRAHFAVLASAVDLLGARREVRKHARISVEEFAALLKAHSISAKEVAAQ